MFNWVQAEKLLLLCSLTEDRQEQIVTRLLELEKIQDNEFAQMEIEELITELMENQHDPITMGFNYSQTDITRHLKRLR